MKTLWIDFETRSRCDLKAHGVYNYCRDPSTDVLCMSWAFDDDEVQTWLPGQPLPDEVRNHTGQIRAHNAAFERLVFWYVLQMDFALEQFYCTATQARANCAPGSLEDAGRFAGAAMRKDHRGSQLVRALCIPRPDGTFNDDAALMTALVEYCERDVRAMRAISQGLRGLSDVELADYHVNERINDHGVLVDVPLAKAAQVYAAAELEEIQALVASVTEGAVTSVRSPRMREWVWDRVGPQARDLMMVTKGEETKRSIDKNVRASLLVLAEENPDEVPADVADVVQCADDLWASSVAKFARMADLADEEDHRVRGAFVFAGGAATGRACVSAQTLVESEYGARPISALAIGEKVLTHRGRFCKVSRVIYKGAQTMYRLKTAAGGWIDCTAQHALLTNEGWVNVEKFIRATQPPGSGGSHAPVYVASVPYDGGSWHPDRPNPRHCLGDRAGDSAAGSATHPQSGELLEIQDGREEPYVWCAQTGRSHTERWIQVLVGWGQHLRSGASTGCYGRLRYRDLAGWLGDTSYRQQQNQQLHRQLGCGYAAWASTVTLTEVTEVVCVGTQGVWDISVERDASYVAQGLIHHNSSYGLQVHNFARKTAKEPEAVRHAMVRGHQIVPAYGKRVTDVLKGMLRPSLMAAPGRKLVTADWSAIEARVNPWLSSCAAGDAKLDLFRTGEDIYKVNASATFGVGVADVDDAQRQVGKVQELACGFGGSVGAFNAMGRVYGVVLPEAQSRRMVEAWRRANPWAVDQWSALERAYTIAMRQPGHEFTAGRVTYLYDRQHLWYALPSGRVLCYPHARFERDGITYAKAAWKPAQDAKEWPRARLWHGLACENIVQAVANDLLRDALRRLDAAGQRVILHVHDEIVLEADDVEAAAAQLEAVMVAPPAWAAGLPLAAEVNIRERYGK